jgi:hypothetical protein
LVGTATSGEAFAGQVVAEEIHDQHTYFSAGLAAIPLAGLHVRAGLDDALGNVEEPETLRLKCE